MGVAAGNGRVAQCQRWHLVGHQRRRTHLCTPYCVWLPWWVLGVSLCVVALPTNTTSLAVASGGYWFWPPTRPPTAIIPPATRATRAGTGAQLYSRRASVWPRPWV